MTVVPTKNNSQSAELLCSDLSSLGVAIECMNLESCSWGSLMNVLLAGSIQEPGEQLEYDFVGKMGLAIAIVEGR
jgi:hypothetical protein